MVAKNGKIVLLYCLLFRWPRNLTTRRTIRGHPTKHMRYQCSLATSAEIERHLHQSMKLPRSMLTNRRMVQAVPVSTAGGIKQLREMADLHIGEYRFTGGYVNPHMDTTLISEGREADNQWKFYTSHQGKVCSAPQGMASTSLILLPPPHCPDPPPDPTCLSLAAIYAPPSFSPPALLFTVTKL